MYLHVFKYTTLPIVLLKFKIKTNRGVDGMEVYLNKKTRTNILLQFLKEKGNVFSEKFSNL